MNFTTQPFEQIEKSIWDTFVDASDEAWLFHRYDFQPMLATWDRRALSFAVRDDRDILAIVPLFLVEDQRTKLSRVLRVARLDVFGGIALKNGLGEKHRHKILTFAYEELQRLARQYDVMDLTAVLMPCTPAYRGERTPRVNPLLDYGCENTLTQTSMIDLKRPLNTIRENYSRTTRYEIKQINPDNCTVREARGGSELDIYYALHEETYHRTGVNPHPRAYFQSIFEHFVIGGLARILLLERDGVVVAAHNTALYKGAAMYWTGASVSEKQGGDNRVLMDAQIAYAHGQNYEWFEVGEVFPNTTDAKLKGLTDFKRSFGGEMFPFYRGRILYRPQLETTVRMLRSIRKRL